jgi:hypothetical protein
MVTSARRQPPGRLDFLSAIRWIMTPLNAYDGALTDRRSPTTIANLAVLDVQRRLDYLFDIRYS